MSSHKTTSGISRRDLLKASGLTLGGLALGGALAGKVFADNMDTPADDPGSICHRPSVLADNRYTYFHGDANGKGGLDPFNPRTPLEPEEMRISFMGSVVPTFGRAQANMSIFVEVGWVKDPYFPKDPNRFRAQDQFIFDIGPGTYMNYNAMGVGFQKMDKIFINHLHADHMGDLPYVYCFGPAGDRKSPLFVFGPGPSGVPSPAPAGSRNSRGARRVYDDGTKAFCRNFREAMRWHTESFSFQSTSYASYKPPTRTSWGLPCDPVPVGDDSRNDCYALIPIELDWQKTGGVAYHNKSTGAKVTHFKVIHCRKGSLGYKLEWTTPSGKTLSMIYTSDTKPEKLSIEQAINGGKGVDVFIHEMGVPPEIWAMKVLGLKQPPPGDPQWWQNAVQASVNIQNSSHTPPGAFAYLMTLLEQAKARPRLTVATHFPTTDDNVECALESVRKRCPWVVVDKYTGNLVWSYDLMVLRIFPDRIEQRRAVVSDYTYAAPYYGHTDELPPKYATPVDQLDLSTQILPRDPVTGEFHFDENGY